MLASSSPTAEGERERGRKREDILRGSTVIYEEAASNKPGEVGGHSCSSKTRGVGGNLPSERRRFRGGKRKSWWEAASRCAALP